MRKINPKSSDEDSFKYSILISLYYYEINFHPERVSKLKLFEDKFNFNHIKPNEFEINNPNVSLTVFDENNNIVYTSNSNSTNKAQIVKLKDDRYAAINRMYSHLYLSCFQCSSSAINFFKYSFSFSLVGFVFFGE